MRIVREVFAIALGVALCGGLAGCSDSSTTTPKSPPMSSEEMKSKMQNMMSQQQKDALSKHKSGADEKASKPDEAKPK